MRKKEVQITTIIGRGTECGGDFRADCSVRVDGTIQGNVTVSGMLMVGAAGCINGDVEAGEVVVGGEINGNIHAARRTELTASARVIGDITTSVIVIDEKAIFQGRCDMNQETLGKRQKPAARVLRASRKSAREAIAEALKEVEEADRQEMAASQETGISRPDGETAPQTEPQVVSQQNAVQQAVPQNAGDGDRE